MFHRCSFGRGAAALFLVAWPTLGAAGSSPGTPLSARARRALEIWRVRVADGVAERLRDVTELVDFVPSPDGEALVIMRGHDRPSIVIVPVTGGVERTLADGACGWHRGLAVSGDSIYFADCEQPNPGLHQLHLPSGRRHRLGTLPDYAGELAVSPDGKKILYLKRVAEFGDLMLIENFR
jgi:hypothetical protein